MSRAIYFIFIGVLGLILDAAININDDFSPLCVYGFNLNSRSVLVFVRNGLFSEYIYIYIIYIYIYIYIIYIHLSFLQYLFCFILLYLLLDGCHNLILFLLIFWNRLIFMCLVVQVSVVH